MGTMSMMKQWVRELSAETARLRRYNRRLRSRVRVLEHQLSIRGASIDMGGAATLLADKLNVPPNLVRPQVEVDTGWVEEGHKQAVEQAMPKPTERDRDSIRQWETRRSIWCRGPYKLEHMPQTGMAQESYRVVQQVAGTREPMQVARWYVGVDGDRGECEAKAKAFIRVQVGQMPGIT